VIVYNKFETIRIANQYLTYKNDPLPVYQISGGKFHQLRFIHARGGLTKIAEISQEETQLDAGMYALIAEDIFGCEVVPLTSPAMQVKALEPQGDRDHYPPNCIVSYSK